MQEVKRCCGILLPEWRARRLLCVDTSSYLDKAWIKGYDSWKAFCKTLFNNNGVFYGGKGDCNNRCQNCTEEDEPLGGSQCLGFEYDVMGKYCRMYGVSLQGKLQALASGWIDYGDWWNQFPHKTTVQSVHYEDQIDRKLIGRKLFY